MRWDRPPSEVRAARHSDVSWCGRDLIETPVGGGDRSVGGMRTAVSRWVGAPLLLLVVLAGCSEPPNLFPDYVDVPGPTTLASSTAPECPRDGAGLGAVVDGEWSESGAGRIPDGLVPVQVLHCVVATSSASSYSRSAKLRHGLLAL